MREIADNMGVRARSTISSVGVDKCIGLPGQRRDFDRKVTLKPFSAAGADRRQTRRNALERGQTEPHLQRRGQEQCNRQCQEGGADGTIEVMRLFINLGRIAGNRDQITAIIAKVDVALE